MKRKRSGITRRSKCEVKEETSKTAYSKRRGYPAIAVTGRWPERSFRCKRDRCCTRSSKRTVAICHGHRCRSHKIPKLTVRDESLSVGIAAQQFSNDDENEDEDDDDDDDSVEPFEGLSGEATTTLCKECAGGSNGRYVGGQQMHTISEEDLVPPDDRNDTIIDSILGQTSGMGEDHRTLKQKPQFHSRIWNRMTRGVEGPAPCTRHKCSRCSPHSCYDHGVDSLAADYFPSRMTTTRPKQICHSVRSCPQNFRCPYNREVLWDAFRLRKRGPTGQSSFLWKVAVGLYEIAGIIKNGLVKLLAEDAEPKKPPARDENGRRNGWNDKRTVGTSVDGTNRSRRSELCNNGLRKCTEAANRTDDVRDCTTRRDSTNCKISTGTSCHVGERDAECASGSCTAKIRKNTFIPNTTSSGSSISSSSSSAPFGYSCSRTEEDSVEKKAKEYCRQDSGDRLIASRSTRKSTFALSKANLIYPTEATNEDRSISQDDDLESDGEIDARCHCLTAEIEDMPEDELGDEADVVEDVYPIPYSASIESGRIYEIKNSQEPLDPADRFEYSDDNKPCRLLKEGARKDHCRWDGRCFQEDIYYNSDTVSETDSAASTNRGYDRRPKRKFKHSVRAKQNRSRLNCRESLSGRNYSVKKIISKTYCTSEQPYETFMQSHLEYFKDIELEEVTLDPVPEAPYSRMPRLMQNEDNNVSSCSFSGPESSSAGGGSRQWDRESIPEETAPAGRRRKRITTCGGVPRSFKTISHHFYV